MSPRAWLLDRAREPSTWRGLVLLATAAGVQIAPDVQEAIVTCGLAVAGLIGALTPG